MVGFSARLNALSLGSIRRRRGGGALPPGSDPRATWEVLDEAFHLPCSVLLIGLVVVGIPWQWWQKAQRLPFIHDITTDLENPPVFVAVLPLRAGAPNSAEYGGPELAAQQRTGYPDLGPLSLQVPPQQAFDRALASSARHGLGDCRKRTG